MPLPLVPIIAAGAQTLSQGINAITQGTANRKSRDFAQEQYEVQRRDALSDWAMQNAYNHPSAQMERFKEAGLNPNLIYGQSNEGTTVRSSNAQSWRPEPPRFESGSVLGAYQDAQLRQAQIDQTRAVTTSTEWDSILKQANIKKVINDTELGAFDLDFKKRNQDILDRTLDNQLQKIVADTQNVYEDITNKSQLREGTLREQALRIAGAQIQNAKTEDERKNLRLQRDLMEKDKTMRDFEIYLNKGGASKNDKLGERMLMILLKKFGFDLSY